MLSIVFICFLAMHFIGCAFWGVTVARRTTGAAPWPCTGASPSGRLLLFLLVGRQILFAALAVLEHLRRFCSIQPRDRSPAVRVSDRSQDRGHCFYRIIIGQVKAVMEEITL